MFQESDERVGAGPLTTPFRAHLDHCRALDTRRQIEECADYIQHVELLVAEFLESYYLVERLWEPGAELAGGPESDGELILEPFYDSLELRLRDGDGTGTEGDVLVCVSGAVSPLRGDQHPALSGDVDGSPLDLHTQARQHRLCQQRSEIGVRRVVDRVTDDSNRHGVALSRLMPAPPG